MDSPLNIIVCIPVTEEQRRRMVQACPGANLVFSHTPAAQELAAAQVVVGHLSPERLSAGAPRLRWFQCDFAGVDRYTAPGALPPQVLITNARGAYGLAIAEHMLAGTLALMKRLDQYHRNQLEHVWRDEGSVTSLEGAQVLLLGTGDIGGSYARMVRALGSRVTGVRFHRCPKPDWLDGQYTMEALDGLLPLADVVALALPGTPQTRGVMDARRLGLLKKPGALLVNGGRGTAVVTDALCAALQHGTLGGAFLDVTDPEPLPPGHPLWDCPRALVTPHIAGYYHLPQTVERIAELCIRNLGAYCSGRPLENLVDRTLGY